MKEWFFESLYDAIGDCVKVLPVLFLAYLLVSYLSHGHGQKFGKFLAKRRTGVMYASFLGCVPQCGFSSVIADLYSRKRVSLGVLIAVFVATSDEAIPIMLTNAENITSILLLIAVKVALALFWGYATELSVYLIKKITKKNTSKAEMITQHKYKKHKANNHYENDEVGCGCSHKHGDCCADNLFLDAFSHTLNILIYIFVATFLINLVVKYYDISVLRNFFTDSLYIQILLASLIGLIPNCAASVLLVELYIGYGVIGFPALIAGLTAGAGVGMLILFTKNKRRTFESVGILLMQYIIGVASGLFLTLFF